MWRRPAARSGSLAGRWRPREASLGRWWILTDDFVPLDGGVATWSAAVARGLVRAGHPVRVVTRARPGLERLEVGCPVHAVRGPSFGRHGGRWIGWAIGARLASGDRVLATTWPVATGVIGRCRRLGVTVDVVAHGSDVTRPPVDERGRSRVLRNARWWAVSRYLAGRVEELGVPGAVLPCPIDPRPAVPPEGPERWVAVGRATPLKGLDRVIRLAEYAGVELDVVGDGPALPALRRLAAPLGDRVRLHGRVSRDRVAQLLRGARLSLLLPRTHPDGSGAEGFGLVLAEAASLGVATVGCATGGVPEAAAGGLVLADPDDVPGSVAAIRGWWSPARCEQARAHLAAHHGVDRVVRALVGAR